MALALALTFLIRTFSRVGTAATVLLTAALVGVVLLTGALRHGVRAPMLVGGAAVMLTVLAAFMLLPQADMLKQRVLTAQADRADPAAIYAAHWATAAEAPLCGYGLGSFKRVNGLIMTKANVAALGALGAAHNVNISWIEQAGTPGTATMFVTIAIAAALCVAVVARRRMRSWLLGIEAALLVHLHGVTDFALEASSIALWASVTLGLDSGLTAAGVGRAGDRRTQTPRC